MDVEQSIRSIERRCGGPYVIETEMRDKILNEYRALRRGEDFNKGVSAKNALETYFNVSREVIQSGDWDSLDRRVVSLMLKQVGCDYDFNEVILSNPLDGVERTVNCPNCKTEIVYTAPAF